MLGRTRSGNEIVNELFDRCPNQVEEAEVAEAEVEEAEGVLVLLGPTASIKFVFSHLLLYIEIYLGGQGRFEF